MIVTRTPTGRLKFHGRKVDTQLEDQGRRLRVHPRSLARKGDCALNLDAVHRNDLHEASLLMGLRLA